MILLVTELDSIASQGLRGRKLLLMLCDFAYFYPFLFGIILETSFEICDSFYLAPL